MPPAAIGIAGTLYLYRYRIRIVAGRFEVEHARMFIRGEGSTLPDDRAALVAERQTGACALPVPGTMLSIRSVSVWRGRLQSPDRAPPHRSVPSLHR
jgi:hypothetical protein